MPNLFIIAGCNGAGKTTASYTLLPDLLDCREFVNADEIAKGLSPFNQSNASIDAGRLMLERMRDLLSRRDDFAFETTLAPRTYLRFVERARRKGYFISLIFFWLPTPEQAIERVALRVSQGGHWVPDEVVLRRYYSGLENLFSLYMPICDSWVIYDNSSVEGVKKVAIGTKNETKEIIEPLLYEKLCNYERTRNQKVAGQD